MLLGYLGPETTLPLTSAVSALVGLILLFGRRVVHLPSLALRGLRERLRGEARMGAGRSPHIAAGIRRDGPSDVRRPAAGSHSSQVRR